MKRARPTLTRAYLRQCARDILRLIHPTVAPSSNDVDRVEQVLTLLVSLARKTR